mgnify:CR=1 FL=1
MKCAALQKNLLQSENGWAMETKELYREILNEHNLNPAHKKDADGATLSLNGVNPSCGDSITLNLKIEDEKIVDGSFTGAGCAVSQASCDMMLDLVIGKSVKEAAELGDIFMKMIRGESSEKEMEKLSDSELSKKTEYFKEQLANGKTLDDILPEAFAVVREASKRAIGLRHYDVQLIGGIILHQGRIAEMKTGEGKTLVETLPAYLNALTGKGVHIVTVNEYLAKRDSEWMGKIFKFLGMTVGLNLNQMNSNQKRKQYQADIMYTTNNELGFDYLRDNMVIYKEDMVQRPLNYAIVDEIDSILIDEARTPLIISGRSTKSTDLYKKADSFVRTLEKKEIIDRKHVQNLFKLKLMPIFDPKIDTI